MKIVKKSQRKIVIFTAVKNRCILHGRVFVMKFNFEKKIADDKEACKISQHAKSQGSYLFQGEAL